MRVTGRLRVSPIYTCGTHTTIYHRAAKHKGPASMRKRHPDRLDIPWEYEFVSGTNSRSGLPACSILAALTFCESLSPLCLSARRVEKRMQDTSAVCSEVSAAISALAQGHTYPRSVFRFFMCGSASAALFSQYDRGPRFPG